VYAANGGLVKTLYTGAPAGGRRTMSWDGRDEHGKPAPAGVYLLLGRMDGASRFMRVVLAR
jgi:flagellar hook assembly protein FlgD